MPKTKAFDEQTVIDAVTGTFWQKGYAATSVEDLTAATGLSRSSLYATFGDKRTLYLRTLENYLAKSQCGLETKLGAASGGLEKIRALFASLVADITGDATRRGCFAMNATTELSACDADVRDLTDRNREGMTALFVQWVKDGQREGMITADVPAKEAGAFLYATFVGLRLTGLSVQDKKVLNSVVRVALGRLEVPAGT